MKFSVLNIILLFLSSQGFAQPEGVSFGKVVPSDFTTKVFAVDSSASAVVLFDYGYTYAHR
jgi:hypothetical protein